MKNLQYTFYNFTGNNASTAMPQGFDTFIFIIVLGVLLLQLRTRRVRFIGLVVMPVVMLLVTLPLVSAELLSGPLGMILIAAGFLVGLGIGAVIGSMMEVTVNEKDGAMMLKGSFLAVLVWAVVIGLKIFGKDFLRSINLVDAGLLTSAFLMLTVGMMISRRAVAYWRYLQMKKQAPAIEIKK